MKQKARRLEQKAERRPEQKVKQKPEQKLEKKAERRPEQKAEKKAERKSEQKAERRPEQKVERKPDYKPLSLADIAKIPCSDLKKHWKEFVRNNRSCKSKSDCFTARSSVGDYSCRYYLGGYLDALTNTSSIKKKHGAVMYLFESKACSFLRTSCVADASSPEPPSCKNNMCLAKIPSGCFP